MAAHGEPVGHPRHVVDRLLQGRPPVLGAGRTVSGYLGRAGLIPAHQIFHDLHGPALVGLVFGAQVDPLEHEGPQLPDGLGDAGFHGDLPGGQRPVHHGVHHGGDPVSVPVAQQRLGAEGQVLVADDPRPHGVDRVVAQVGDPVGVAAQGPFGGGRGRRYLPGVRPDAVEGLPGEVEGFQHRQHPHRVFGMQPAPIHDLRQGVLSGVPEGGVADVVAQADRLGEGFVEAEGGRHRPTDLGHLQGVGEPGDEVVVVGGDEHLGLVGQAADGVGMHDPVAVPLEDGAERVRRLRPFPSPRVGGPGGGQGQTRALRPFPLLAVDPLQLFHRLSAPPDACSHLHRHLTLMYDIFVTA